MSEFSDRDVMERDASTMGAQRRSTLTGLRQPPFTPLDYVAGLLVLVMIWGPLAAGAFRS